MFIGGRPVHANQNIDIGKRIAASKRVLGEQWTNESDENVLLTEERPKELVLRHIFPPLFRFPPQGCLSLDIEQRDSQREPELEEHKRQINTRISKTVLRIDQWDSLYSEVLCEHSQQSKLNLEMLTISLL